MCAMAIDVRRNVVRCHRARLIAAAGACSALAVLATAQPPQTVAFAGMLLVTEAGSPVSNGVMLVREGRIVAAGPVSAVKVPADAQRVWLTGKTVIPGLINAHGHAGDTDGLEGGHYSAANVMRDLRLYAAYGITTVFSLGGDEAPAFAARDAQETPALDRSRIYVAGPVLTPSSPDSARADVDKVAALNADIVKIRVDDNLGTAPKMRPEIYRAVIDEAHRKGMRAAVHVFYLDDAKDVVAAGADYIAHSVRDKDVDQAFVDAMKARHVLYSPTLTREVSTFVYETTPAFFSDPFFLRHADEKVVSALKEPVHQKAMRESTAAQRYKAALPVAERNLKKLSDAGVTIVMGTDTGPPARWQGYFEHVELEMMVRAGLTPGQAIDAATRDAARAVGASKEIGTLEPGKWADFVVLDGDPLDDIRNTKRLSAVYIAGNKIER